MAKSGKKHDKEESVLVNLEKKCSRDKKADIIQATFKHYFDMAMDHHTKAGTTSHILLIIVGAIITIVGLEQTGKEVEMASGLAICLIGLFGAVWARKQHERYFFWQHIAHEYQKELAKIVRDFKTGPEYYECAKKAAKDDGYRIINEILDRHLWVSLHLIVAIIGIGLFLSSYCKQ